MSITLLMGSIFFFCFSCKIVKTACFKNLVQKMIQVTSILGMYQSFSCLSLGNLLSNLSCFDTCNFLVLGAYLKYFVVIIISHWFQYVLFVILSAVHHKKNHKLLCNVNWSLLYYTYR